MQSMSIRHVRRRLRRRLLDPALDFVNFFIARAGLDEETHAIQMAAQRGQHESRVAACIARVELDILGSEQHAHDVEIALEARDMQRVLVAPVAHTHLGGVAIGGNQRQSVDH